MSVRQSESINSDSGILDDLWIRVRNSSLAQDGGEVLVMCLVGFAREVASRVS